MRKHIVAVSLILVEAVVLAGGCSRNFSLVDESVSETTTIPAISVAEVTQTEEITSETSAELATEAIVVNISQTKADETKETETSTQNETETETESESELVLETNEDETSDTELEVAEGDVVIHYDDSECIIISPPEGYYAYNSDMSNFVTFMSDSTDDFFTVADMAETLLPSGVQENFGAEYLGDNCYVKKNDSGCDFYYFHDLHLVKITYTTYSTRFDGEYIGDVKLKDYLMEMAEGFQYIKK